MGLGDLESAIMDVLWQSDEPLRVRDVMAHLEPERSLAYTTVMTVLDNLHTKGMVTRDRVGRGYSYRASRTREEAAAELLRQVLRTSGDAEQVMLHFASSASEDESRILRRAAKRTTRSRREQPS